MLKALQEEQSLLKEDHQNGANVVVQPRPWEESDYYPSHVLDSSLWVKIHGDLFSDTLLYDTFSCGKK